MITRVIKVDREEPQADLLKPAAHALQQGGLVAFPTETVYGLAAVWDNAPAVKKIFEVKGRPQDNPLIVHECCRENMPKYFDSWDEVADVLSRAFCPGPFTLIMKRRKGLESPAAAGLDTIAVRVPSHPVCRKLIELCGKGLAAPSANISGRPSPTNALDALEDLNGKVPYIIDGGSCDFGVESSIVSWTNGKLELLRPGGISAEEIEAVLREHKLEIPLHRPEKLMLSEGETARAPGMKYRHYAPKATVHVLSGKDFASKLSSLRQLTEKKELGSKPSFYISKPLAEAFKKALPAMAAEHPVITFSDEESHAEAARGLFAAFRSLDRLGVTDIWAEEQEKNRVGAAYMNRLLKAAAAKKKDVKNAE